MLIQRVNRTDAEKVFIVIQNVNDTSITTGMGAVFCNAATGAAAGVSADGIQAVKTQNAVDTLSFAGVAAQDIQTLAYGLVQCWGYVDSVMLSHRAGNTTIGGALIAETVLQPTTTLDGTFTTETEQDGLSVAQAGVGGGYVQIFDTVVLSLSLHSLGANVWGKGFVRAI
jgi:hypothetical protein